jgi:hypothetical protein
MVEFETKRNGTISAVLSAVLYVIQKAEGQGYAVVMAGGLGLWDIDKPTYEMLRDAMRGYAVAPEDLGQV